MHYYSFIITWREHVFLYTNDVPNTLYVIVYTGMVVHSIEFGVYARLENIVSCCTNGDVA